MTDQPKEFEPVFRAASVPASDLCYVTQVGISAGPALASMIATEPKFAEIWHSDPLVVVSEEGITLYQCGNHGHKRDYEGLTIMSWTQLADMYAAILGLLETWTPDQQTRFRARVDRSLAAWKASFPR